MSEPDYAPANSSAAAWKAAAIEGGRIVLARRIGEADVRLDLPVAAFEGIALSHRGSGFALRLIHREPALCVVIGDGGRHDAARAAAKLCARDLGLPNLDENPPPPSMARRGAGALRGRRRRFAARRATPAAARPGAISA